VSAKVLLDDETFRKTGHVEKQIAVKLRNVVLKDKVTAIMTVMRCILLSYPLYSRTFKRYK